MQWSLHKVIYGAALFGILTATSSCQMWPEKDTGEPVAVQTQRAAAQSAAAAQRAKTPSVPEASPGTGTSRDVAVGTNNTDKAEVSRSSRISPIIQRGEGPIVRPIKRAGAAVAHSGDITLNFEATKLQEFVKVVMSDLLHKSYIIDPNVSGMVSIQTSHPIPKEALIPTLESVLQANGAVLLRQGNMYHIVRAADANKEARAPALVTTRHLSGVGYRTVVVPLRYLAVKQAEKLLKPFINNNVLVTSDPVRNVMILSGTNASLQGLLDTLDIFDVNWLKGMSLGLFPLANADAKTVVRELEALFGKSEDSPLNGLVRMVPIDRINAVLIVTPQASYLDQLRQWITNLDQPGDEGEPSVHVYRVKNGKASDLADVLTGLFGGTGSQHKEKSRPEVAPGYNSAEFEAMGGSTPSSPTSTSSNKGGAKQRSDSSAELTRQARPNVTSTQAGDINIVADDGNNALVIWCTAKKYRTIESALRKLDVVPREVLIEASIVEVTLTNDLQYGLEWFMDAHTGTYTQSWQLNLGAAGTAALDSAVPGFSYAVGTLGSIRGVLNALASETKIHVLSSPSLMVLDNQTAKINVGDDVPIPVSQSTSNLVPSAPTVNAIEYRSTGVLLSVTPRIGEGGLVTMDVSQEVSDVAKTTSSNLDAPTISKRAIESMVAVQSGSTLVLGGLIRDNRTTGESGVPYLHKIPLLGKLFGQTANNATRTELLVLITPRVVGNEEQSRQVTEEFRSKLRGLRSN